MYKKYSLILFVCFVLVVCIFYIGHIVVKSTLLAFSISILASTVTSLILAKHLNEQIENALTHKISSKIKQLLPSTVLKKHEQKNENELDHLLMMLEKEIKKEREHYKNLDSYRKEYLGNVSHELKTPLFNIQGYISTLLDGAMEGNTNLSKEYLKKADKNIERMINIIDDLETISHLESGSMLLDYEVFDIENIISEVFEQMELLANKKNIQLKLLKPSSSYSQHFFVNADKFRIRQVLINLISNSIKYGKENGTTTVSLQKEQEKIIVSVKDNGIGIEEKHLPRIFERFYRVDKGRSREQGGTGLGLAIVKHIIEAHKQTISVQSTLNKGSIFTFTLESK